MASSRARYNNKKELTGYEIRVSRGYDAFGKQRKPYVMTWKLPEAWWNWSKKTQQNELKKAMYEFEADCKAGKVKLREEKIAEALEQAKIEAERIAAEAEKPTISKAFERFVLGVENKKKKNTITGYKTNIKRFINCFDDKKIEKISEDDCEEYINVYLREDGLAVSTIRKHYSTLSAFLKWCVSKHIIMDNPLNNVSKPVDNSAETKVKIFTVEEMRKIFECVEKEPLMWQAMIYLLAESGMRRGEIAGLRWVDIDFGIGKISVVNNAQYTEGVGVYDTTTKSKKPRDIYVSEKVVKKLKEWKEYQKEVLTGQGLPEPTHIFTHLDGGARMNPQAPTAYLRRFGEKYGIPDCHPHKFRHTMATHMIRNGVDVKTVSEILGHSSIEITLKLYVHSDKNTQQKANEKYCSLLWGTEQ